jgi:hypothetical protein
LAESDPAFREFVAQNPGRVHQAAFVWHFQLRNPEISPLVLYLTCRTNGHANTEGLEIKAALRKFCAEEYITLGIFAANGDPQYYQTNSIQKSFNETIVSMHEAIRQLADFASFAIRSTSSSGRDTA